MVSKSYMGASLSFKRKQPDVKDSVPYFSFLAVMRSQRSMRSRTLDIIFDNPYRRVMHRFFFIGRRCAMHAISHSAATALLHFRVVSAANSITVAAAGANSIRWKHLPGGRRHRNHGSALIAWLTRTSMSMTTISRSGWICMW